MAHDPAPLEAGPRRWRLSTGVDRNALYLLASGVALLGSFSLLRAFGNAADSEGRSVNLVTALALFAVVPFVVAIYRAARDGFAELGDAELRLRVGFLVDAAIPYADIDLVGGPISRPRSTYGVSPSYRRHELSLGRLERAVEVTLRRRVRMGTPWLFPFLRVDRIWLGVAEPEQLIDELRARLREDGP
jgi:hypothetical protein